jgi:hypothetical protein
MRENHQMQLPQTCEHALLERFLKAEAMILWTVRAAQTKQLPPDVLEFLRRHEKEESEHLSSSACVGSARRCQLISVG